MEKRFIDKNLWGLIASTIKPAMDVTDGNYTCLTNLVRICAMGENGCRVKMQGDTGTGLLLSSGACEYFQVEEGDVLVITGSANIASV